MNEAWLIYACGILLTRLVYLPNDNRLSIGMSVWQLTPQLLLVLFLFHGSVSSALLLVLLVVIALAAYLIETPHRIQSGFRLITLGVQLLSPWALAWFVDPVVAREWGWSVPGTLLISLFGVLILANEANYLVRMLFNWCNLVPKLAGDDGTEQQIDEEEYKAGRVIGMLERSLIFLIVYFTSDLSAVGFVLAAKGLIRIQQLKDRKFSEYMLIGTLASVLCAAVVALTLQAYQM